MTVEVVEYDDAWPGRFAAEADAIRDALGNALRRIEHVGSTSVPGLAAKPVVDIALSVESLGSLDVAALEAIGYEHVPEYEDEFPQRRYFTRPGFHVHAYEQEHPDFLDYIRFRDYLRTHPEDRDAYGQLKLRLAGAHDRAAYQDAKRPFIDRLVETLRGR